MGFYSKTMMFNLNYFLEKTVYILFLVFLFQHINNRDVRLDFTQGEINRKKKARWTLS